MSARDCKHGQLARSCNLCEAAEAIKAAFFEGYSRGFDNGSFNDPKHGLTEKEYELSDAKVSSEST